MYLQHDLIISRTLNLKICILKTSLIPHGIEWCPPPLPNTHGVSTSNNLTDESESFSSFCFSVGEPIDESTIHGEPIDETTLHRN